MYSYFGLLACLLACLLVGWLVGWVVCFVVSFASVIQCCQIDVCTSVIRLDLPVDKNNGFRPNKTMAMDKLQN